MFADKRDTELNPTEVFAEDFSIFVASGFPVATGTPAITEWSSAGNLLRIVHDYSGNTGLQPQSLGLLPSGKLLSLVMGTATGRLDFMDLDGGDFDFYADNAAALAAGTRSLTTTSDGSVLVARTAGVERFNSARQRVGVAARYATNGTCTATAIKDVAAFTANSLPVVVSNNAIASPNNKLNLYNASTGICISGAAPAGPAATMWPVSMVYATDIEKLLVLYYPFTGSTTNAQVWSFDVDDRSITGGTLVYNDLTGDIAVLTTAPGAQSGDLTYYSNSSERFLLVGTTANSIIKLDYDYSEGTASKVPGVPLIYNSIFSRTISSVLVVPR